jgi:hypothetical protein
MADWRIETIGNSFLIKPMHVSLFGPDRVFVVTHHDDDYWACTCMPGWHAAPMCEHAEAVVDRYGSALRTEM